ncbi:unnamed protein product, partial [Phaeothamnion confervicola]
RRGAKWLILLREGPRERNMGVGQSSFEDKDGGLLAGIGSLQRETQAFAKWTMDDVRELHKRFKEQIFGFAMVEPQFECVMSFKRSLERDAGVPLAMLFKVLDNDGDGRIDGLELIGG